MDSQSPSRGRSLKAKQIDRVEYVPPSRGFLSYLPASCVPYAELIRLHKPHGLYMIYYPYIVGLMYASKIASSPIPASILVSSLGHLLLWTVVLRSAGCAWNDNIDQDYDRETSRCRMRPIARGAISTTKGHVYTAFISLLGFFTLRRLPRACALDATVIMLLAAVYPFGKRFTHYPQIILGSVLSWAIVLSSHALGVDPFAHRNNTPTLCLVAAILVLVVFYDTVYAWQDTKDDINSGVKGMAMLLRNNIKTSLFALALLIAVLLLAVGTLAGMTLFYFGLSVCGTFSSLAFMIVFIKMDESSSYAWYSSIGYTMAIFCLISGFVGEYLIGN